MAAEKKGKIKAEQVEVEFRLRERERFLRTLIANLPGAVFRCRADDEFTKEFISDGCFGLTGYNAAEIVGEKSVVKWNDLVFDEDRKRVFSELRRLVEGEKTGDGEQFEVAYRLTARDGSIKQVRDRFRAVYDSIGKINALEGFITDITDQTLAEERVRKSEARYKLLAENMRDLVCLHDLDGKYLYVSPSSETLLGYTPAEMLGRTPYDYIHPEDVERLRDEAHPRLLKGETGIIVEYRMREKSGEYCWFETMAQTVAAPDGEIVQLQTVSRDVSKRKEAEAETAKAQEELAQLLMSEQQANRDAVAARIEAEHASRAKDEFLQMVSHEFRTPLTTIKTLVRVLQHDGQTKAQQQKHLETIAAECDRQIDMILNLLDVSRIEEGDVDLKREPVDINSVLISCDKIEHSAAHARDQIFNVETDKPLPKIAGDEKAIRRALCTIIENAIKYTPENGMITVTAKHVEHLKKTVSDAVKTKKIAAELFGDLPKQMDFSIGKEPSGEEIAVIICDTGRGILPADIPKIFGKFYRGAKPFADSATDGTPDDAAGKAETPGVGLGLYLAKRLITALDGRITVNSEVGRGSCFTIFLPVWKENTNEKDTLDEYDFDENKNYAEKTPVSG